MKRSLEEVMTEHRAALTENTALRLRLKQQHEHIVLLFSAIKDYRDTFNQAHDWSSKTGEFTLKVGTPEAVAFRTAHNRLMTLARQPYGG